MIKKLSSSKKQNQLPIFIIGTGRCGTHLMYELFNAIDGVHANHILHLDGDSFYRYAKWNDITVDLGGFYIVRDEYLNIANKDRAMYLESNPYLSFHIRELYERYNARFIFLIRNPKDVVNSHIKKGWYQI